MIIIKVKYTLEQAAKWVYAYKHNLPMPKDKRGYANHVIWKLSIGVTSKRLRAIDQLVKEYECANKVTTTTPVAGEYERYLQGERRPTLAHALDVISEGMQELEVAATGPIDKIEALSLENEDLRKENAKLGQPSQLQAANEKTFVTKLQRFAETFGL